MLLFLDGARRRYTGTGNGERRKRLTLTVALLPKDAAQAIIISVTYWIEAHSQRAIQTPLLLQDQLSRPSGSTRATGGIWKSSGKGDLNRFVKALAAVLGSSHI